jgi:hypothetical protein
MYERYRPRLKPSCPDDPVVDEFAYLVPPEAGIAASRNGVFYHFRDKDIIFMFEDDYYPVKEGWEEPYIKVLSQGVYPVLFALDQEGHGDVLYSSDMQGTTEVAMGMEPLPTVLFRERLTTQMLCINTKILGTLGYFNSAYADKYGFEDSEWGSRGRDSGLFGSHVGFPCLEQEGVFAHIPDPASSDGKTVEERQRDIDINWPIFSTHSNRPTYLSYPYNKDALGRNVESLEEVNDQ